MDRVKIYDADNHGIGNYVTNVQEIFGIASFGTREEARVFTLEQAIYVIALIVRKTNGHYKGLRYEFV